MNTYNDHIQVQILLDALNYSNSALVDLPSDYLTSCYHINNYITFAAALTVTIETSMVNRDTINFLLGIPFAADLSHVEDLTRTSNDINWNTYE